MRSFYEFEYAEAEEHFRLAIAANPNNAYAHDNYAFLLSFVGRTDEAIEHVRQAQRLNPSDPIMTLEVATVLMMNDRCDDAEREAQRGVTMDPSLQNSINVHAMALMCMGRYEDAIQELEPLMDAPEPITTVSKWLGHAYGKVGRHEDALRILRIQENELRYPRGRAWVHLGLGQVDEAVEAYKDAISGMESLVVQDMRLWVWDELQDHPGYQELLRLVKLDQYVR